MAKSTGFEFVDQIEFGRFLVILWRFSLFTKFQIIVVLVVKWGVWAISGKIAIKLPKIAQIQFDQRIQIRLTLPFPKMIDFLKFGQFWVIRLLNKGTELVGYSPFKKVLIHGGTVQTLLISHGHLGSPMMPMEHQIAFT